MNHVQLHPWTLKHPAVVDLTVRARLAYVELLADTRAEAITEKWLHRLIRKDHRESLIAAGLIVDNRDGTYSVIQPDGMYAPLGADEAV